MFHVKHFNELNITQFISQRQRDLTEQESTQIIAILCVCVCAHFNQCIRCKESSQPSDKHYMDHFMPVHLEMI